MIALAERWFGAVKQHFNLPEGFIRIKKCIHSQVKMILRDLMDFVLGVIEHVSHNLDEASQNQY